MSADNSSAASPKRPMNWPSIAAVIFIALAISGYLVYANTPANQTGTRCTISAEGTGFYVTVLTDSGAPVVGAQVSGSRFTDGTCVQNIGTQYTNSSGTVSITDNVGSYYMLAVGYQGRNYPLRAPIFPMETTYVILKIPSGNYSTSEVFEGGCITSNGGVTCQG
jgi:hypothetical protein